MVVKMKMKSILSIFLSALLCTTVLSGCGGNESPVPGNSSSQSASDSAASQAASSEVAKPDANLNPLTGEYTLKDRAVGKRPVAVVVNNIKKAWPQNGISSADICYEMVTEGGITRILAVFSDYQSIPKIGSVRSARHQFTDCLVPMNAILVHIGGSKPGYAALDNREVDHIDGISFSSAFTQDSYLRKTKGQEYSNFTNGELIGKALTKKKISTSGSTKSIFNFSPKSEIKGEATAVNVAVPFSSYATTYFDYDATSGKYLKSEKLGAGSAKTKQIDQNNNAQVAVSNVFVLYANVHRYNRGDFVNNSNWSDVEYDEGGSGFYLYGGTKIDFTWKKTNYANQFQFTKADGTDLLVNPGNSWFCITANDHKANTVIN